MSVLWLLIALAARAEVPLPDYRDELAQVRAWEVQGLIEQGDYDEAVASALRFQRALGEDAQLEYLVGWAAMGADDPALASRHYARAVELDPTLLAAWVQLGEVTTRTQDLDEAQRAWEAVSELTTTGDRAWLGPLRLAEVAARRGEAAAMETHLREALRRGFSFRDIAGMPHWRAWYADPRLHDSLDKMVTVYGDAKTRDALKGTD